MITINIRCPGYFVLQRFRKDSQSSFQYYFALQDLHKLLSSTTLYYKGFAKIRKVRSSTTSDALSANKKQGFRAIPKIEASPGRSIPTASCNRKLANHNRTASARAAIKAPEQPFQGKLQTRITKHNGTAHSIISSTSPESTFQ